jgi:hypothetical protein
MSGDLAIIRALLVALAVAFGIITGIATAILCQLAGQNMPAAIIKGGAAFAGTVALLIVIMEALGLL